MTLPVVLALVALSLTDPSGDAFGDGGLTPPTAPVYADAAVFDLQSVTLDAAADGTRLAVTLGSLGQVGTGGVADGAEPGTAPDPAAAPAGAAYEPELPLDGFLPSIVDVYLGEVAGGPDRTLPGPDLLFPQGTGWQYAVRLTSDGAFYVDQAAVEPQSQAAEPAAPAAQETTQPADAGATTRPADGPETGQPAAAPTATEPNGAPDLDALPRHPLEVLRVGNTLVVYLPFELPEDVAVQTLVGVYDPFSRSGWRPLAASPSPWAFSGPGTQVGPVVDLLARDAAAQRVALQEGVLPRRAPTPPVWAVPWLWLVAGGLAIALLGLVLRARVPRARAAVGDGASTAGRPGEAGEPRPAEATDDDADPAATAPAGRDAPAVAPAAEAPREAAHAPGDEAGRHEDDLDDELIDPRASAADVLAREIAVAEAAGAEDQDLLIDGHDEFLLDTGEREAAAAAMAAQPELDLEEGAARFASAFDDYLLDLDDPQSVDVFLGEFDDEESFWHPRARKSQVRPPAAATTTEGGEAAADAAADGGGGTGIQVTSDVASEGGGDATGDVSGELGGPEPT